MNAIVCPSCLTLRDVVCLVTPGAACRRCGEVPETVLSRREITACLRARKGAAA